MLRILLALFLSILPFTAAMALHDCCFLDPYPGETITTLSPGETRVLLKQSGFPELANSWKVDGHQGWYENNKQCLIQQQLAAYSTPKEISPGVYRSSFTVLTASKLIINQPDCKAKLPAPQRQDLKAGSYGNKPPVDVAELFAVGEKTTDAQLKLGREAILLSQQCFKSPSHCPVAIKYHDVHDWIHRHLSLIRLNNILNVGGLYVLGKTPDYADHFNICFYAANKDRGFKFQVQQLVKSWSGRIPHTVS